MNIIRMAILAAAAAIGSAQTINTVAGNSSWGLIYNVASDSAGNLYAADCTKHVIYKVDPQGVTTVIAGTGRAGYGGDGTQAATALINAPCGVALGPDGSIYFTDSGNDRIRKIAPNGIITTIAGSVGGFLGDNGPATAARLNGPISIVIDAQQNLYFTDSLNLRIRKITPGGIISTIAGTGRLTMSGSGAPATSADGWFGWLAVGPDGSIYATDDGDSRLSGNKRVRRIAPNGIITTVAGTGVAGFTGDGGPATAAQFRSVGGVAVDPLGNIFIADPINNRIRKVDPSGTITTYAGTGVAGSTGDGGPALQATVNAPFGMSFDSAGNLLLADRNNTKIRRISPPPTPTIRSAEPVLTSFGGKAGFASNMYIEIYGTGFGSAARLWGGADFSGSNAPTSLDGVSVTVNGRPAFIYYISANQININTPEDMATGDVQIQVRTPLGASNIITARRARVAPTLQTVSQFLIGGKQYVVALTPDFSTYIGRPGMLPGVNFAATKPGDTISIYALGCGPTSPPTFAGMVAAQGSPMALPYELRIGGMRANVTFAGVVGGTIGLCQINTVVPQVGSGDQTVEFIVDGVPNAQGLWTVIQ